MPGGLFGSSQGGTVTQNTVNPTQQAQLPFLRGGWQNALDLQQNNPITYNPDPHLSSGYNNLANTSNSVNETLRPAGNGIFFNAANGGAGVGNSPAYPGLSGMADGSNPFLAALMGVGNGSNPFAAGLSGIGSGSDPTFGRVSGASSGLYGIGNGTSPLFGQIGADVNGLNGIGAGINPLFGNIQGFQSGLSGLGGSAASLAGGGAPQASDIISQLQGLSSRAANAPYPGMLTSLAGSANPDVGNASRTLSGEASGAYLNSNPYLDRMFGAAASPVTRAYMTATAPQTDASYEAAGRYGSGALANSRSQNQQDLGQTLNNLASNIYGTNYSNERTLQNNAAGTLGNLGLSQQGLIGSLLNSAGNQYQTGLSNAGTDLSNAGSIAVNNANTRVGAINAGTGAMSAGGQLGIGQLGAQNNALTNAGQLGLGQLGQQTGAFQSGGALDLNSLLARNSALASGLGGTNSALSAGLGGQNTGLGTLQSGFQAGNNNLMQALGLFPSLLSSNFLPAQQEVAGGQGLTGMNMQAQQQPWQNLAQFMNLIGQPTTGSNSRTDPIMNPSIASSVLGTGLGASQLLGSGGLGGLGSLFGSGASSFSPVAGGGLGGFAGQGAAGALSTAAVDGGLDFGPALATAAMWIVCTELMRQGRLPKRWWAHGAKVFNAYPEITKRGYYVWAIPSVRHLRKNPNSLYSRVLEKAFNWRAEDIAARAGVKGARKLWRGRAVTAALALPCLVLGAFAKKQDWQAVYRDEAAA